MKRRSPTTRARFPKSESVTFHTRTPIARTIAKMRTRGASTFIFTLCLSLAGALGAMSLNGCSSTSGSVTTIQAGAPDVTLSKILVVPGQQALADNSSLLRLEVHLFNSSSTPIAGFKPPLVVIGEGFHTTFCSQTDSNGVAICTVKTGTPGSKAFVIDGVPLTNIAGVIFKDPRSTVEAPSQPVPANGQQTISIEISLRDQDGAPIVGVMPTLQVDGSGTNTVDCQPSDAQGKAQCLIRSDTPGEKIIRVVSPPVSSQPTIVFSSPLLIATKARAEIGAGTAPLSSPDNKRAIVRVTLLDGSGNPVSGHSPTISVLGSGTNSAACEPSNTSGQALCFVTSDTVGEKIVSVTDPVNFKETIKVTFANPYGTISVVNPSEAVLADGVSEAQVEVHLFNDDMSPATGVLPRLDVIGNGQKSVRCESTDTAGTALCFISSTQAGAKTIVVQEPPVVAEAQIVFDKASVIVETNKVPAGTSPVVIAIDTVTPGLIPEIDVRDSNASPTPTPTPASTPGLIVDQGPLKWNCVPSGEDAIARCFITSENSGEFEVTVLKPTGITESVTAIFVDSKSSLQVTVPEALADGTSAAQFEVHLKTSLGLPSIAVTPVIEVVGEGTITSTCTTSNLLGVSTCSVTSTQPGLKHARIKSPVIALEPTLQFNEALSSLAEFATGSLEAIAGTPGTKAKVRVTLLNGSASPRVGIVPLVSISGSGSFAAFCTPTNSSGISDCEVAADTAGDKTFAVFSPPLNSSLTLKFYSNTKSCAIPNGTGSSTWTGPGLNDFGTCSIVGCNLNYSLSGGSCVADTRTCNPMPANASSGTQTWTGSSWGTCAITACASGYRLDAGTCVPRDITPNAFSFTNQTNLERSTLTTSGAVTVSGFEGPLTATVSGGDAQIKNHTTSSAWSTSVDVDAGDSIELRQTSAASFDTPTSASLTLGTANVTWQIRTRAADQTPDAFSFTNATNQAISSSVISNAVTITGIEDSVQVSATGAQVRNVSTSSPWSATVTVSSGQQIQVLMTSSSSYSTAVSTTVTVGTSSTTWTVTTSAKVDPDAFSFTDQTGVEKSAVVTSNAVTLANFQGSLTATCSASCQLDRNESGSFSSTVSGFVAGDKIRLRVTAAGSFDQAVTSHVTLGTTTSQTWTVRTRAQDTSPDTFSFTMKTAQEPSTQVESDLVTLSGFDGPISVSVTGGAEVSVNGGAWTALATGVQPGDTLKARMTSSSSFLTQVTTTIAAGTASVQWKVETRDRDTTPNTFSFTDVRASVSTLTTSNAVAISGFEGTLSATVSGGDAQIMNTTTSSAWGASATISSGDSISVRVTSSATAGSSLTVTVTVGSTSATWLVVSGICPDGYILVPALSGYTTADFCVAQTEMKIKGQANGNQTYSVAFIAETRASGTPWVNISRNDSRIECAALGANYDLITNAQWQTIARNIEMQGANWSSGVVGTGSINRGHSDNSPSSALSISDTSNNYDQTGNSATDAIGSGWEQKRTHVLSNGEVIWDLAGNVSEWIKEDISTNFGSDSYISQVTTTSYKNSIGPAGTYTSLSTGQRGGLGYLTKSPIVVSGTPRAVHRGGIYGQAANTPYAGIFFTTWAWDGAAVINNTGFRCVYNPPVP